MDSDADQPTFLSRVLSDGQSSGYELPSDLQVRSRARLGRLVLFMGAVIAFLTLLIWLTPIDWGLDQSFFNTMYVLQAGLLACHAVFYWVIRSPRFGTGLVLNLGLVYQVALCFIISAGDQWVNHLRTGHFQDMSFSHLIIVIYPMIIPNRPLKVFLSASAAALSILLGFVVLSLAGMPAGADEIMIQGAIAAISVAMAMFGAHVLYRLSVDVARARRLGSYEIETLLGKGGMGEVWRAKHRLLVRPAAVKLVRPEVLGSDGATGDHHILQRFEREAQATAMMRSPHTIQIYDFGVSDDGVFYYVMELLEGEDLRSLITRNGPVPPGRAVHILRQICDSLAEAHESGLIHRDVKPANVFVCRYGRRYDFVKVLDFGLVKPSGQAEDAALTKENVIGGTPAFIAPEQVIGNRPVDARTDIYALGCVGYWLVTGRFVFEGSTPMETMMHHAKTGPVAPSKRTELAVPEDLDRVLLSCLEKDPEARPRTADEVSSALGAVAGCAGWTQEEARAWWETHMPRR